MASISSCQRLGSGSVLVAALAGFVSAQGALFTHVTWTDSVVASLGDVDGDGVQDYAVGWEDHFGPRYIRAYSSQDGRVLWRLESWGQHAARAGDVDLDGRDDVIVAEGPHALILRGFDGIVLRRLAPPPGRYLNGVVAGGVDLDGDGIADQVSAIAPTYTDASGVAAYSGSDGSLIFQVTIATPPPSRLDALHITGDVDADGTPDVLASDGQIDDQGFFPDYYGSGGAWVLSGRDGALIRSWSGPHFASRFGESASPAGDVDADGWVDVVVGAPVAGGSLYWPVGEVSVFSGRDGQLLFGVRAEGREQLLGEAVGDLGDLDADGHDDVLVSYHGTSFPYAIGPTEGVGETLVLSGRDGSRIYRSGTVDGAGSLDGLGDVDGDGLPDYVIGDAQTFGTGFLNHHERAAQVILMRHPAVALACTPEWSSYCDPILLFDGAASLTLGPGLTLRCHQVRKDQVALLMWSLAPGAGGPAGSCLGPPLRFSPPLSTGPLASSYCIGSVEYRFEAEMLLAQGLFPGTEVHAQYLLRGPPIYETAGTFVSNSVRFTVWR